MSAVLMAMAVSASAANAELQKLTGGTALQLMNARDAARVIARSGEVEKMPCLIAITDNAAADSIEALGIDIATRTRTILTADIPVELIDEVASLQGVRAIEAGRPLEYTMARARSATGVDKAQAGAAPLPQPYTGAGTVVGVIDGGLDYNHPAFRTTDGKTMRLRRVWDQNAATGVPPKGFSRGSLLSNDVAIRAAKTDLVGWSHGTHVMNIAAGADMADGNTYYGIARDADLVFCTFDNTMSNFNANTTSLINAISYIYAYADSVGCPAVINMSLGTQIGPHDGTSLVDVAVDELTGEGKIAVGAVGNDGQVEIHITKRFTADDARLRAGLAFKAETQGVCPLSFWGEKDKGMKIRVLTVDNESGKTVYQSRAYDCSTTRTQKVILQYPTDKSSGYFNISTGISALNGKPNAMIELHIADFYPEKSIVIEVTGDEGNIIHGWTSSTYAMFRQKDSSMDIPDLSYSVSEIGGTGKSIISVGSYTTTQNLILSGGVENNLPYPEGQHSQFSNRGPSVDGRMKPDVSAPGAQVVSALNSNSGYGEGLVATHTVDGETYYYGSMIGTSMASPHVAGIVALWLEANPKLTPELVRDVLDHSVIKDEFTGQNDNNEYGRGKIDAYAGLKYILQTSAIDEIRLPRDGGPVSCRIVDDKLQILFLDNSSDAMINIYTVTGTAVASEYAPNAGIGCEHMMDLGSCARGIYIVSVKSGDSMRTYKFIKK